MRFQRRSARTDLGAIEEANKVHCVGRRRFFASVLSPRSTEGDTRIVKNVLRGERDAGCALFSQMAPALGFWPAVVFAERRLQWRKRKRLGDVFGVAALFGALLSLLLLENRTRICVSFTRTSISHRTPPGVLPVPGMIEKSPPAKRKDDPNSVFSWSFGNAG